MSQLLAVVWYRIVIVWENNGYCLMVVVCKLRCQTTLHYFLIRRREKVSVLVNRRAWQRTRTWEGWMFLLRGRTSLLEELAQLFGRDTILRRNDGLNSKSSNARLTIWHQSFKHWWYRWCRETRRNREGTRLITCTTTPLYLQERFLRLVDEAQTK